MQQNTGTRGCSLVGPLFQEVRFKVHDPKVSTRDCLLSMFVINILSTFE